MNTSARISHSLIVEYYSSFNVGLHQWHKKDTFDSVRPIFITSTQKYWNRCNHSVFFLWFMVFYVLKRVSVVILWKWNKISIQKIKVSLWKIWKWVSPSRRYFFRFSNALKPQKDCLPQKMLNSATQKKHLKSQKLINSIAALCGALSVASLFSLLMLGFWRVSICSLMGTWCVVPYNANFIVENEIQI